MLEFRRSRTLVAALATLAGMLCGAAQAAMLSLSASGEEAFVCAAHLKHRDGRIVAATPTIQRITAGASKDFDLGPLPPGESGLSPNFGQLVLECWGHEPTDQKTLTKGRSYSIVLNRDELLWLTFDESSNSPSLEPPRDHTVVHFTLASTGHERYGIRIIEASVTRADGSRLDYDLGGAPYLFTRT